MDKRISTSVTFFFLLSATLCLGQESSSIDSLIRTGVMYHDGGEHAKAIEMYSEALKIDRNNIKATYEMAVTYSAMGDHKTAIKYCNTVIKQKKDYIPAYVVKGSSLDDMGKTQKSVNLFKKAISQLGSHYLLYYNLGVNYSKMNDIKKAEAAFINAIKDNRFHASSHYLLGIIEQMQNHRIQSLMSFYYFLLLEPSSARSKTAYRIIRQQLAGNAKKSENNQITVEVDSRSLGSGFAPAEMSLAMFEATNMLDENKDKTSDELFIDNTTSIFNILGEMSENNTQASSLWWDFYVPFFHNLAKSEYMDVFCYYTGMSENENAKKWLAANEEKVEDFVEWVQLLMSN